MGDVYLPDPDVKLGLYLPPQRTYQQTATRIADLRPKDYFGYHTATLLVYLPHQWAKPFIKRDCQPYIWTRNYPISRPPLVEAKKLLLHAWKAANAHGALNTLRCMDYFKGLFWMGGYDERFTELFDNYEFFGKPQLVLASEVLGFDWRKVDDGKWSVGNSFSLSDTARENAIETCLQLAAVEKK